MNVVVLTSHYPPPYNANAVRAYYLVKALRQRGHGVTVVPLVYTLAKEGHFGERVVFFDTIVSRGQEGKYVRPPLYKRVLDLLLKHSMYVKRYAEAIISANPYVIIAAVPAVESPMIAYKIMKKYGVNAKLIVDMQDLVDDYRVLERPWLAPLIKLYLSNIYKVSRKADAVFAPTEYVARTLRKRLRHNRIHVVPNGVDTKEYLSCYREHLSLARDDGPFRALFLGDLNYKYHYRGLIAFIDALKIINHRTKRLVLDVIGAGKYLGPLRKYISTRGVDGFVVLHGYLSKEKMIKVMARASFALSGKQNIRNRWILDTIRLTTYEYLACGLPILGYGPPGSYTEYFLNKHRVGIYIPSDNPNDIAKGAERLLSEIRHEGTRLFEKCRRVAETYDWDKIMSQAADIIEDILRDL